MRQATTLSENIRLRNTDEERALLGPEDRTLRLLRRVLGVRVYARKRIVTLQGERAAVEDGLDALSHLLERIRDGQSPSEGDVEQLLRRKRDAREAANGDDLDGDGRVLRARDDTLIKPKSANQAVYVEAVKRNDIVFSIGPAGTGKTYLAVAMAIRMMRAGEFRKLCLVRPAVEAGEHLGFLPGDMTAKVSPYLRPLYDALGDFLDFEEVQRYLERDVIEVVPLAYMRGRTLDNAFIILDEGQNTTSAQMKMFLTRMGRSSKIIVTGDVTQTDLPKGRESGLLDVRRRLSGVRGIAFCELGKEDIVRHPLVQRIVEAYEGSDAPAAPADEPGAREGARDGDGARHGDGDAA